MHPAITLVRDEPLLRQPPHHSTDRRRRDREPLRDVVGRRGLAPQLDLVDRLEVVLDRRRELRCRLAGCCHFICAFGKCICRCCVRTSTRRTRRARRWQRTATAKSLNAEDAEDNGGGRRGLQEWPRRLLR